jgi:hypothetical protein
MQQEVSVTLRISSVAGGAGVVGGKLIGLTSRALKLFGAVLRRLDNKRGESLTQRKGAAPEKTNAPAGRLVVLIIRAGDGMRII